MTKAILFWVLLLLMLPASGEAQLLQLEGQLRNAADGSLLSAGQIEVSEKGDGIRICDLQTDSRGRFSCRVPAGKVLLIRAFKPGFYESTAQVDTRGRSAAQPLRVVLRLDTQPGFQLDLAMVDAESGAALRDVRIEVFNHDSQRTERSEAHYDAARFVHMLEPGKRYTILIRKGDYLNRRIEAEVGTAACQLCIEGLDELIPELDPLPRKQQGLAISGTLRSRVELQTGRINTIIPVENIYYDLDQSTIREDAARELDKVAAFLRQNPTLIIELGSHTDSRGSDAYNLQLSHRRAQAAVDYLRTYGAIEAERLRFKGYGETQLLNDCDDGSDCTEAQHQRNRRTELRIVDLRKNDTVKSLRDILQKEGALPTGQGKDGNR